MSEQLPQLSFTVTEIVPSDPKWSDLSTMKYLTCRNHQSSLYLTKNPWSRSLFCVAGVPELIAERYEMTLEQATKFSRSFNHVECSCPFSDLVEVIGTHPSE